MSQNNLASWYFRIMSNLSFMEAAEQITNINPSGKKKDFLKIFYF